MVMQKCNCSLCCKQINQKLRKTLGRAKKTQVLNRTLHYSSNDQHILTYLSDVQIKVTFMEALLAVNGHQMVFTKPLEWLVTEGERERARERQRGEGARRISQSQSRVTTNPRHAHCLARAHQVFSAQLQYYACHLQRNFPAFLLLQSKPLVFWFSPVTLI